MEMDGMEGVPSARAHSLSLFSLPSQGGIGPAGLATEDLHVLDFTDPASPRWHRCVVFFGGGGEMEGEGACRFFDSDAADI